MQNSSDNAESLNWSDKQRFQRLFAKQAMQSFLFLSAGMGVIALLLPILLVIAQGYDGNYSISYFYHAGEASGSGVSRNILVGSLWATGAFLFLFHGLSRVENWILNIAGVAAISIAMNPMAEVQCPPDHKFHVSIHYASAVVFFLCLAIVAIGFSKGRVRYIIWPPKRRAFKLAYNLVGGAMVAMPAAVALLYYIHSIHTADGSFCETHWIFWMETLGIWAFAAYWFVKTYEYKLLLGVRWSPTEGLLVPGDEPVPPPPDANPADNSG